MTKLFKKTLFWFAATILIYIVLYLFIDRPVDLWVHSLNNVLIYNIGSYISLLSKQSIILYSVTLSFIFIIIHDTLKGQKPWTKILLYICLSVIIAKTIGDSAKYLLGRYRPIMFFDYGLYGFRFLGDKWELLSTPSGHTLRIFAVMTALAVSFKRYRIVFFTIAVLVGISRVAVTAHYPSDVVLGAFVGITTACWTRLYMYEK